MEKNFGKMSSLIIALIFLATNTYTDILNYVNGYYISVIAMILMKLTFFMLTKIYYNHSKIIFKTSFVLITLILCHSTVQICLKSIENQEYSSITEKMNALDLSWVIIIPILFPVCLLTGLIFDIIKKNATKTAIKPK